jgi:hypothetical protein
LQIHLSLPRSAEQLWVMGEKELGRAFAVLDGDATHQINDSVASVSDEGRDALLFFVSLARTRS